MASGGVCIAPYNPHSLMFIYTGLLMIKQGNVAGPPEPSNVLSGPGLLGDPGRGSESMQQSTTISSMDNGCESPSLSNISMPTPSKWPAEIVDSMAWSVQFFDATHNSEHGAERGF